MQGDPSWPMPPHLQLCDFLAAKDHKALLEWAFAQRHRFKPATVTSSRPGSTKRLDCEVRIALTLGDLGPIEACLEERLLEALPELMALTGTKGSKPVSLELELAAHGPGAHFAPHFDVPVGKGRQPLGGRTRGEDRVLSAVLYFHREPKRFSGGNLRIYRFGASSAEAQNDPVNHVDLEPLQNSLAVFPSWAVHAVTPVECPSGKFEDYRFAVNCWYCRKL